MTAHQAEIARLRKQRPRSRFLRGSVAAFFVIVVVSWLAGGFSVAAVISPRRMENLSRFIQEIKPNPLNQEGAGLKEAASWARDLLADRGFEACITTLAIAAAAIVLAGLGGTVMAFFAARNLASPDPFLPAGRVPPWKSRPVWRAIIFFVRGILMFVRAIPEYIWAFLFLAMFGAKAWPAVLALAVHNMGILGKLNAEVVENVEPAAPAAMRGLGSSRAQISILGIFPMVMPRFLLYFFYRWETCVREATVLGLLGFASLGYWIQDARARDHYDDMVFFIMLGAVIVLVGDLVSLVTRRIVRQAC